MTIIISLIITSLMTLTLPAAFQNIIDHGLNIHSTTLINRSFIDLCLLSLLLAAGSAMRYYSVRYFGNRLYRRMRQDILSSILYTPSTQDNIPPRHSWLPTLTTDCNFIRDFIGASLSTAARNVLLAIGGFILMVFTSPFLMLWTIILTPIILLPLLAIGRFVKHQSHDNRQTQENADHCLNDIIQGIDTIHLHNYQHHCQKRFEHYEQSHFKTGLSYINSRALLTALVISLVFLSVIFLLWLGIHDIIAGNMSAGELTKFVLYAVFTAASLAALSELSGDIKRFTTAWKRINYFFNMQPKSSSPQTIIPTQSGDIICFDTISFAYNTTTPILKDCSFTIQHGEFIGLTGRSGIGKTTLLRLLCKFHVPQSGRILIFGHDSRTLEAHQINHFLSVVPQEPYIFNLSIHDNIAISYPSAHRNDVIKAAQHAQIHEEIMELPDKYDTILYEQGKKLSTGQKQRLAIARAFLKNAPILLLDEPTSALDDKSQDKITRALRQLTKNRTTIMIAHRAHTLENCDRVWELKDQKIHNIHKE